MDYINLLKNSGLSNRVIGDRLGIGERTVQAYFRGDREIPKSTQKLIDYEFGGKAVKTPIEKDSTTDKSKEDLKVVIDLKDEIIQNKIEVIESLKKQLDMMENQLELFRFQLLEAKKSGT